jgi:hypothetical protein
MKLGHWFAVLGCVGLGMGAVVAAEGCTATACTGTGCNGVTVPIDSDSGGTAPVVDNDAAQVPPDTGSTPTDPCNSCLYGQCVGAYSNCVANASCLDIYQCATAPACAADGGSCTQDCYNAGTATGQTAYVALASCDQAAQCPNPGATCASVCNPLTACTSVDGGAEDGGAAPTAEDSGTDAASLSCTACQAASCSSELAACAAGSACAAYNQCVLGCSDSACSTACASAYSAGQTAATALGTCTTTSCPQCD